jgi:hypothetical protein
VTGSFDAAPRPLVPGDAKPVHALVLGALGSAPYADRALDLVAAAERGDSESRALVIARDGAAVALALYGPVGGTSDTWQLHMLLIAPGIESRVLGASMIERVVDGVRRAGGRLLVAELPADAVLGRSLSLLRANGFRQEGRVPDFFREGVALLFLRREL